MNKQGRRLKKSFNLFINIPSRSYMWHISEYIVSVKILIRYFEWFIYFQCSWIRKGVLFWNVVCITTYMSARICALNFFLNSHSGGWSPNGFTRHVGHWMTYCTCPVGFGGMKIGRGNRSTRRKPAPAQLCPPQIPLDQTRARTWAANRLSYGAALFAPWYCLEVRRNFIHIWHLIRGRVSK
jgi:hypothetical protein